LFNEEEEEEKPKMQAPPTLPLQAPTTLPPPPIKAPVEKAFEEDDDGFVRPVHKEPPRAS
jgi:hypothetical protein